jgi:hypothetical protein
MQHCLPGNLCLRPSEWDVQHIGLLDSETYRRKNFTSGLMSLAPTAAYMLPTKPITRIVP